MTATHSPTSNPPTPVRTELMATARRLADRQQRKLNLVADLAAAMCAFALLLVFVAVHGPTTISGQAVHGDPWPDSRLIVQLNLTKARFGDQGVAVDRRSLPAVLARVCPFLGSATAPDFVPADASHAAEWRAVRLLIAASGRCSR